MTEAGSFQRLGWSWCLPGRVASVHACADWSPTKDSFVSQISTKEPRVNTRWQAADGALPMCEQHFVSRPYPFRARGRCAALLW